MPNILLFLLFPALSDGYKILVYSTTFSKSHIVSNARIADVLALDGHDVTLLELHYEEKPGVVEAANHAKVWRETFYWPQRDDFEAWEAYISMMFRPHTILDTYAVNSGYHERYVQTCDYLLNNTELLDKMRAQKFDVFIGEQLTMCGSGISHVAGIKTHIWLSSCPIDVHVASLTGLPIVPSYVPAVYENVGLSDMMSMPQRITNLLHCIVNYIGFIGGIDDTTALFRRRFGPDFPDIRLILGESPLVLASVNEFFDFPRPLSPRVLNIGGISLKDLKLKSLSGTEFEIQLSKGKKGVVFFSLGSMISFLVPTTMLPDIVMTNILKAFGSLRDYHFIVKADDNDEIAKKTSANYPNIYLTPWTPQMEILAHERLRLFITHAGYNSLLEAARLAVPIVGIGVFGDQTNNALLAERNGWGKSFNKLELLKTHTTLEATIRTALQDERLKLNAKRAQKLFLSQPLSPEERLTKWMRFLEENDGRLPELKPHSIYMSFVELHNLDIWTVLVVGMVIAVYALLWLVRLVVSIILGGRKVKKE